MQNWRRPVQQVLAHKILPFLGVSTLITSFAKVVLAVAATFGAEKSIFFGRQYIAHTFCKGGVGRCSKFWRWKVYLFWEALHCAHIFKGGGGRCSNFWHTKFYHFLGALNCANWCRPVQHYIAHILCKGGDCHCSIFETVYCDALYCAHLLQRWRTPMALLLLLLFVLFFRCMAWRSHLAMLARDFRYPCSVRLINLCCRYFRCCYSYGRVYG